MNKSLINVQKYIERGWLLQVQNTFEACAKEYETAFMRLKTLCEEDTQVEGIDMHFRTIYNFLFNFGYVLFKMKQYHRSIEIFSLCSNFEPKKSISLAFLCFLIEWELSYGSGSPAVVLETQTFSNSLKPLQSFFEKFDDDNQEVLAAHDIGELTSLYSLFTQDFDMKQEQAEAYCALAILNHKKGLMQTSIDDCNKALDLKPNFILPRMIEGDSVKFSFFTQMENGSPTVLKHSTSTRQSNSQEELQIYQRVLEMDTTKHAQRFIGKGFLDKNTWLVQATEIFSYFSLGFQNTKFPSPGSTASQNFSEFNTLSSFLDEGHKNLLKKQTFEKLKYAFRKTFKQPELQKEVLRVEINPTPPPAPQPVIYEAPKEIKQTPVKKPKKPEKPKTSPPNTTPTPNPKTFQRNYRQPWKERAVLKKQPKKQVQIVKKQKYDNIQRNYSKPWLDTSLPTRKTKLSSASNSANTSLNSSLNYPKNKKETPIPTITIASVVKKPTQISKKLEIQYGESTDQILRVSKDFQQNEMSANGTFQKRVTKTSVSPGARRGFYVSNFSRPKTIQKIFDAKMRGEVDENLIEPPKKPTTAPQNSGKNEKIVPPRVTMRKTISAIPTAKAKPVNTTYNGPKSPGRTQQSAPVSANTTPSTNPSNAIPKPASASRPQYYKPPLVMKDNRQHQLQHDRMTRPPYNTTITTTNSNNSNPVIATTTINSNGTRTIPSQPARPQTYTKPSKNSSKPQPQQQNAIYGRGAAGFAVSKPSGRSNSAPKPRRVILDDTDNKTEFLLLGKKSLGIQDSGHQQVNYLVM